MVFRGRTGGDGAQSLSTATYPTGVHRHDRWSHKDTCERLSFPHRVQRITKACHCSRSFAKLRVSYLPLALLAAGEAGRVDVLPVWAGLGEAAGQVDVWLGPGLGEGEEGQVWPGPEVYSRCFLPSPFHLDLEASFCPMVHRGDRYYTCCFWCTTSLQGVKVTDKSGSGVGGRDIRLQLKQNFALHRHSI